MAWRIHLTNQTIHQLDIVSGDHPVVAVWTRATRIAFFDLESGAHLATRSIHEAPKVPRQHEKWLAFMDAFCVPATQVYLPLVRFPGMDVYVSSDGKLRLYHTGEAELWLQLDGDETRLDTGEAEGFYALDIDRALGTIAALDERGKLHLFQQDIPIGVFDIGLHPTPDLRMTLAITRGSGHIFASDGRHIVLTDASGEVYKCVDAHYHVGNLACSAGGSMVAVSDVQSGVLRLYRGSDLTPTHQKIALDLMLNAASVQLLGELPPTGTGVKHLAASAHGILAFTMAGIVCVTDAGQMDELPQQWALL